VTGTGHDGPPALAPVRVEQRWGVVPPAGMEGLRVVDLSSMWAGPLAAALLARAGALVTKVASLSRPDGARATAALYGRLHADGRPSIVVDFGTAEGRRELHRLVANADVVIEASRPRALE
jgi:crotonobetainyl-CoA:carnitine CoA-transferase CaiB-like acyl-CoA transferase